MKLKWLFRVTSRFHPMYWLYDIDITLLSHLTSPPPPSDPSDILRFIFPKYLYTKKFNLTPGRGAHQQGHYHSSADQMFLGINQDGLCDRRKSELPAGSETGGSGQVRCGVQTQTDRVGGQEA